MSKIRIPKLFISRQIDTPWFAGGTTNFLPFNKPLYKCPENLEPSAPDATKRPQRTLFSFILYILVTCGPCFGHAFGRIAIPLHGTPTTLDAQVRNMLDCVS